MKVRRFAFEGATKTAKTLRNWNAETETDGIVKAVLSIKQQVIKDRDVALRRLTAQFDATEQMPARLRVHCDEATAALKRMKPALRDAMEVAAANITAVAEAQVSDAAATVELPQGQTVKVREVAVNSAGIYAPGGRAT